MEKKTPLTTTPNDELAEQRASKLFAECINKEEEIAFTESFGENNTFIQIFNSHLERVIIDNPVEPSRKIVVYDPISKFWGSVRRRIFDLYQISITGAFNYDTEEDVIICRFWLDAAALTERKLNIGWATYYGMYQDHFHDWSSFFEKHFLDFMQSENGYTRYRMMQEGGVINPEEYRKFFNRYLRSVRLRTRADDQRSAMKHRADEERLRQLFESASTTESSDAV